MPSDFLASRHRAMLTETSGSTTVEYTKFVSPGNDPIVNIYQDVDESTAYSSAPIVLPARIINIPSKSTRDLAGMDISYEAIIRLSTRDLTEKKITLNFGDIFKLPEDPTRALYVVRIVNDKQSGTEFLEANVYVDAKRGHRVD